VPCTDLIFMRLSAQRNSRHRAIIFAR